MSVLDQGLSNTLNLRGKILEEMNPLSPDIISLKALGFCVLFFIHDKLTMIYSCYQFVQIPNFYKIL